MQTSRRNWLAALTALPLQSAAAQTQQGSQVLPAAVYHPTKIAFTGNDRKKGRRYFYGATHAGFHVEMHETVIAAGEETHPPHRHEHEEIVLVAAGTLEVHIGDESETAETGAVIFFASNLLHNARNSGQVPCRYYVLELRGSEA